MNTKFCNILHLTIVGIFVLLTAEYAYSDKVICYHPDWENGKCESAEYIHGQLWTTETCEQIGGRELAPKYWDGSILDKPECKYKKPSA